MMQVETLATALVEASEMGITSEEIGLHEGERNLDRIADALVEAFSYRDEALADYWRGNLHRLIEKEIGG